ncbi:MAG: hypothetical protein SFW35_01210 [Chitinophagales bacterium]|nr:hypothetical protein [Chitinophagales bacterium]
MKRHSSLKRKPLRRKRLKPKTREDKYLLDDADLLEFSSLFDDEGEIIGKQINEERYEALINRVRYMNSYKQPGYKFTGVVPEPKTVGYYKIGAPYID